MLRVSDSSHQRYVPFQSARLQSEQPTRGEVLLALLIIVGAVVASAAGTARWASSSIKLQVVEDVVGQWAPREPEHRLVGATPPAASLCSTAQRAAFADKFVSLSQTIGDKIGQPLECAHTDPATGDVLQPTSTGLAVYRAGSHVAIFTDGYRHWALAKQGLVTWEGDAVDPAQ